MSVIVDVSKDDLKETSAFFRYGLILGIHTVADAMIWIDAVLVAEHTPEIALIEASLCGSQGSLVVADWLAQVPGQFDKGIVARRLFGVLLMLLERDSSQSLKIIRWLYTMVQDEYFPDEEAESQMFSFDEDLSMALDGIYGSLEEINDRLAGFLDHYKLA